VLSFETGQRNPGDFQSVKRATFAVASRNGCCSARLGAAMRVGRVAQTPLTGATSSSIREEAGP